MRLFRSVSCNSSYQTCIFQIIQPVTRTRYDRYRCHFTAENQNSFSFTFTSRKLKGSPVTSSLDTHSHAQTLSTEANAMFGRFTAIGLCFCFHISNSAQRSSSHSKMLFFKLASSITYRKTPHNLCIVTCDKNSGTGRRCCPPKKGNTMKISHTKICFSYCFCIF